MIRGIVGAARALFGPRGRGKLGGSRGPAAGGSRMAGRLIGLAVLVALVGLGLSVYARFFHVPALAQTPQHRDDGAPLPEADEFEHLAKTDPIAMYDKCLARYQREVRGGFITRLLKRERVKGEPPPPAELPEEVIRLAVRGDLPDPETGKRAVEVSMKWESGARKFLGSEIRATLYNEKPGADGTGGRVVTWRPDASFSARSAAPINGPLAEGQSRYCIRDAGLYGAMLRTYTAWKQRREAGTLKFEYLGKRAVEKAGGRVCHVIKRTCAGLEVDAFELGGKPDLSPGNVEKSGFTSVTVMIDAERWLQVGSELERTGPDGKSVLIASYYFRDIELNPTFPPDAFTEAGMKSK